jgi:hypothetical protein
VGLSGFIILVLIFLGRGRGRRRQIQQRIVSWVYRAYFLFLSYSHPPFPSPPQDFAHSHTSESNSPHARLFGRPFPFQQRDGALLHRWLRRTFPGPQLGKGPWGRFVGGDLRAPCGVRFLAPGLAGSYGLCMLRSNCTFVCVAREKATERMRAPRWRSSFFFLLVFWEGGGAFPASSSGGGD